MVKHPAKFSQPVLEALAEMTGPFLDRGSRVLDPFAGTGLIHRLGTYCGWDTVGVEIESEWATMHPQTIVANALDLPFPDGSFDATITSPCYGNRMADSHNAQERCTVCQKTGKVLGESCLKCHGLGYRSYRRNTYKHTLDRRDDLGQVMDLHVNNTGAMQWGRKYRETHQQAWAEATRVTRSTFLLNISNHIRANEEVDVTSWHISTLIGLGWNPTERRRVVTQRFGQGANRDQRVPYESIIAFSR